MSRMTMSCASFSPARPTIRRACSSEVRGSLVLCSSAQSVARSAGVPNGHGPADAIARLPCVTTDQNGLLMRRYSADEIDAFAASCSEIDRCFFIPIARFQDANQIMLRLRASKNNQSRGINWADDFDFAARLRRPQGAVAQLGERCDGIAEVRGSIPLGST